MLSHTPTFVVAWFASSLGSTILGKTLVGGGAKHVRPFMVTLVQISVSVVCDVVLLLLLLATSGRDGERGVGGREKRSSLAWVMDWVPRDIQSLCKCCPPSGRALEEGRSALRARAHSPVRHRPLLQFAGVI